MSTEHSSIKDRSHSHHHKHRHHHHKHSRSHSSSSPRDDQHHQRHHRHHHHRDPERRHRRRQDSSEEMKKLNVVLKQTVPDIKQLAGYSFLADVLGKPPISKWDRLKIGLDCDEVFPNIYIGNRGAAQNRKYLERLGITHVLNTAEGKTKDQVNTGEKYYEGTKIIYMGFDITDTTDIHVDQYFQPAAKFIHGALQQANGKVFVHCLMGMSRSGAMVMAYLMIKLGMTAEKALITVRAFRDIRPNYGFLGQLVDLERSLLLESNNNKRKLEETEKDDKNEGEKQNEDENHKNNLNNSNNEHKRRK